MWSHEISQMTGQFTQQSLMQGAYANSIGMANPGFASEQMAGTAISGVAGIGAPVATMGLAMAGMDPVGLGMRAGMAALPSMGIGGALGAGAAVAAPAMVGMYGAQAVGNQMMQGMQQQQNLGMSMRQNYSQFQNGGRGFSNAQTQNLGQQIRGMTHEVGAGGEMASFKELSGLASNMGNMGFVQTTRDVQQFGQKFRQMVDTMKTIAKDLGTNLEAAAEMATGMRGSGLFQSADQIRMAQQMRGNAVTGNISTMETGQMASIGSQIARSVGGYGKQGAFAGAKTIGQIGRALESGTLTEDDIYNATGQTGAAGRTAMATSMMQNSARFMKSNKGRIMLASMAGEDGTLDEDAVQDLMSGSMGIGNTMQNVGKNMKKVGAANFMRNEGRLRSAALEKFGGNIGTMQLMQWTNSMGIDIESMGDREMILAKRMTGMGNDELEVAVKMAKNLRRDAESGGDRKRQDEQLQSLRQKRSGQGVQGIRNSFNQFREKVQGGLQQAGAELYNEASNWIEGQINEMTGMYATALTDDTRNNFRQMMKLGSDSASGTAAFKNQFGLAGAGDDIKGLGKVGMLGGNIGKGGSFLNNLALSDRTGPTEEYEAFGKFAEQRGAIGFVRSMFGGKSITEKAGWDDMTYESDGAGTDNKVARAHAKKFFEQRRSDTKAVIAGARSTADKDILAVASTMGEGVLNTSENMEKLGHAGGDQYMREMETILKKEGGGQVRSKLRELNKVIEANASGPERTEALKRKAQLMQAAGLRGGLKGKALLSNSSDDVFSGASALQGTFKTQADRENAYGKAMLGDEDSDGLLMATAKGAGIGAVIGTAVLPGIGTLVGAGVGGAVGAANQIWGGDASRLADERATGAFARSKKGKDLMRMGFVGKGDTEAWQKAKDRFDDMAPKIGDARERGDHNMIAEYETMRGTLAARALREGKKGKEDSTKAATAKKYFGGDEDKMMEAIRGTASVAMRDQKDQNEELAQEKAQIAQTMLADQRMGGMYSKGGLMARGDTSDEALYAKAELASGKHKGAQALAKIFATREKGLEAMAGATGDTLADAADTMRTSETKARNMFSSLSSADLKSAEEDARAGFGGMGGGQLREVRAEQSRRRRAGLNVGRKGANIAAAGFLGFEGMSKTEMHRLQNAKGSEGMIAELEAMGGEFTKENKTDIATYVKELKTGKSEREDLGTADAAGVKANAMERLRQLGEGAMGDKRRAGRLEQDKAENPVQAQMLEAMNRMANAMEDQTAVEGEGAHTPKTVEFGPTSLAALADLK